MTSGFKEHKIMHYFSRAMNIHFCLTKILLHANILVELRGTRGNIWFPYEK
jgi:hypothetical protein